jgi:DNA-binding CsgD family transcriptional regulator
MLPALDEKATMSPMPMKVLRLAGRTNEPAGRSGASAAKPPVVVVAQAESAEEILALMIEHEPTVVVLAARQVAALAAHRPERLWLGPGLDLTAQEQVILRMIVDGHTNRTIGTALFVSEKTVGNYVSRLLRKLGMRRRTELAAFGARLIESDQPPT